MLTTPLGWLVVLFAALGAGSLILRRWFAALIFFGFAAVCVWLIIR